MHEKSGIRFVHGRQSKSLWPSVLGVHVSCFGAPKGIVRELFPRGSRFQREHHFLPSGPRVSTRLHTFRLWEIESQSQLPCSAWR